MAIKVRGISAAPTGAPEREKAEIMYAVIRTGGKQYKVAPDDVLDIEKIPGEAGEIVEFTDVLMLGGEGEPQIGTPLVAGATVGAEVVKQFRGEKIIIFKKRRRHNSRRRNGHRQNLTAVRITEILTGGAKPKGLKPKPAKEETKAAAPKKAEAPKKEATPKATETPKKEAAPKKDAAPKAEAAAKPAKPKAEKSGEAGAKAKPAKKPGKSEA
jgi:large subunit ribosomal protein L21